MGPDKKNNNRKNQDKDKYPEDLFEEENRLKWIFIALEQMMEQAYREMSLNNIEPGRNYIRGYNVQIGPDGIPRIDEFGNFPEKSHDGKLSISDERTPLADLIENTKSVAITVEIPGVDKNDIDLKVKGSMLEIKVTNPKRRYNKKIQLPCQVKPDTTNATYKNGILDISIEKTHHSSDGYHVNIS